MPKRSCDVLPVSEKVEVLKKGRKKSQAEVSKIYGKSKSVKYNILREKDHIHITLQYIVITSVLLLVVICLLCL